MRTAHFDSTDCEKHSSAVLKWSPLSSKVVKSTLLNWTPPLIANVAINFINA